MSFYDYWNRKTPEYYPTMFLDGFSPQQILEASRREMLKMLAERERVDEIKIRTEVKIK